MEAELVKARAAGSTMRGQLWAAELQITLLKAQLTNVELEQKRWQVKHFRPKPIFELRRPLL